MLEAGKELNRRCAWNWLNDVYRNPTVAFNTYSDEQQIEFAHDALIALKEQETVSVYENKINKCECGEKICRYWHPKFCGFCGRKLLWY